MAIKTRKKLTSKGVHSSYSKSLVRKMRSERTAGQRLQFIINAWRKLQNPWITVENPSKDQTNRKFIKVRTNDWWGNPKFSKE